MTDAKITDTKFEKLWVKLSSVADFREEEAIKSSLQTALKTAGYYEPDTKFEKLWTLFSNVVDLPEEFKQDMQTALKIAGYYEPNNGGTTLSIPKTLFQATHALIVRAPFAQLIADGKKTVELQTRTTTMNHLVIVEYETWNALSIVKFKYDDCQIIGSDSKRICGKWVPSSNILESVSESESCIPPNDLKKYYTRHVNNERGCFVWRIQIVYKLKQPVKVPNEKISEFDKGCLKRGWFRLIRLKAETLKAIEAQM
jgi:hypothetical protein